MSIELAILIGSLSISMSIIVSGWVIKAGLNSRSAGEISDIPPEIQNALSNFDNATPAEKQAFLTRDDVRRRKSTYA